MLLLLLASELSQKDPSWECTLALRGKISEKTCARHTGPNTPKWKSAAAPRHWSGCARCSCRNYPLFPPPRRRPNAEGRSREYLTLAAVKQLLQAAGQVGRYGARDRTLLLLAYRHAKPSSISLGRPH